MFEMLLLVSCAAAVVCSLKGRPARGFVALLLLAGGMAFAVAVQSGLGLLLMPVAALAAAWLAWAPAEPGSRAVPATLAADRGIDRPGVRAQSAARRGSDRSLVTQRECM